MASYEELASGGWTAAPDEGTAAPDEGTAAPDEGTATGEGLASDYGGAAGEKTAPSGRFRCDSLNSWSSAAGPTFHSPTGFGTTMATDAAQKADAGKANAGKDDTAPLTDPEKAGAGKAGVLTMSVTELPMVTCSNKHCPQFRFPPGTKCSVCNGYMFGD
jgi:hypothetical protein